MSSEFNIFDPKFNPTSDSSSTKQTKEPKTTVKEFDVFTEGLDFQPGEENSEVGNWGAAAAGVLSGIVKIPEGFVSLGALVLDAGFGTEYAKKVEDAFAKINVFEPIAEQKASGKFVQELTSLIGAGGIALKILDKAVKAKKAGQYINIGNKNVIQGARKANQLNKASKAKRFAAVTGATAAGEFAFVADVEDIGTIGDLFEGGPTELDRDVDLDPATDAQRKLLNRLKFGAESLFITPFVYGAFKGGKALLQRGQQLAYSNSKIEKVLDKIAGAFRSRGYQPKEFALARETERGRQMADTNFAMEQVKRIDQEVNSMFPEVKVMFDRSSEEAKSKFLKELDEALFSGDLKESISPESARNIIKFMQAKGASQESIDTVLGSINNVRSKFDEMLEGISGGPLAKADIPENLRTDLRQLMGDKTKQFLGNTYRVFEDSTFNFYNRYKPTQQDITKVKEIFKRYAAKNGNPITDLQADEIVQNILNSVRKTNPKNKLPYFKYEDLTAGATDAYTTKSFARTLEKETKDGVEEVVIGPGSKAFRKLFGEIEDARYSIYEGTAKLSAILRKNQLFDDILDADELAKANVTPDTPPGKRGFFFSSPKDARAALPNNEIVKIDPYVQDLFKDGVLVNRLQGQYTTKEIAESFATARRASDFMQSDPKNPLAKFASWGYRNLFLTPKVGSQYAKTVLSIPTHFRNFFSSGAFSLANGILFNPKYLPQAIREAKNTVQVGLRDPKAMERYRELLELGIVNSNVKMGDLKGLMKDVRFNTQGNVASDSIIKPMIRSLGKAGVAMARGAKKTTQFMQDAYVAEDDFWKITNFYGELARRKEAYAKAGIEKGERELKEEVAEIVKNTIPNYARVGEFVRAMRVTPFGNFMSWPAEIFRTGFGIMDNALKEIADPITGKINPITSKNPLKGIGMQRLIGAAAAFAILPTAIVQGTRAIFGVSDEEAEAARTFVSPWSTNSQNMYIKDSETGEYYYSDWSTNNVYDTLTRPFTTVLNEIQKGMDDKEPLIKGFVRGMAEALDDIADPFIGESIFTEAVMDIYGRDGVTKDGKVLYTEQTPDTERWQRIIKHLVKTQLPQYKQFVRVYDSATGKPDPNGDVIEIDKSIAGVFGFRLIKLDPKKSMGFMIADYLEGQRNSTREFTGGPEGVLKVAKSPQDVIERYYVANKALFETRKKLLKQIRDAKKLGLSDNDLIQIFEKRGIAGDYERLVQGVFKPYAPSEKIEERFREISRTSGLPDPYAAARSTIESMKSIMQGQSLYGDFNIELNDFLPSTQPQSALPEQPMPNPQVVQSMPQNQVISQTGLTPTEQALLSPEEQQIRLRQRGLS